MSNKTNMNDQFNRTFVDPTPNFGVDKSPEIIGSISYVLAGNHKEYENWIAENKKDPTLFVEVDGPKALERATPGSTVICTGTCYKRLDMKDVDRYIAQKKLKVVE